MNVIPKIFVSLPAYGQTVLSPTVSSLLALSRAFDQHGIQFVIAADPKLPDELEAWNTNPDEAKTKELMARATMAIRSFHNWQAYGLGGGFGTLSYPDIVEIRNIFVSIFYDRMKDATHLLFIDSDMNFTPELIMDMIRTGKPLVGALCPKKKLPIEFAGRAKQGEAKIVNGFMQVAGVGGAIMLISREVITAMLAKWPELSDTTTIKNHAAKPILDAQGVSRLIKVFNKLHINGEEFSEDLSFCHRWSECGGEVWANIMHPVGHIGLHEFQGAYFEQIKDQIRPEGQPAPMPMTDAIQPAMIDPTHTNGAAA